MPERIVRAMSQPIIDHRGPKFASLLGECLEGLKRIFLAPHSHLVIYPGSGTGAWEATLVNTLSPGDRVVAVVNGHFAALFAHTAAAHGIETEIIRVPYGAGIPADDIEERLANDNAGEVRAVLVVHNETSTGVTSNVKAVRKAIDAAGHPALLLVDVVSSLASIEFRTEEWGVDVALTGPQKGLMLPPGLAILTVSEKAIAASQSATCARAYWDWSPVIEANRQGRFPYTPATMLLFGLRESIAMLEEEGLDQVFERHARLAEACRRSLAGLGLEVLCADPAEYSNTVTAVLMPDGADSDKFVDFANQYLDISLGIGLGDVKGKVFRIGHLGSLNEMDLLAGMAGLEMTLSRFGIDVPLGAGMAAAESYLAEAAPS